MSKVISTSIDGSMTVLRIESTSLDVVAYDSLRSCLFVGFKSQRAYVYQGVPVELWQELIKAPSHGAAINAKVKPYYSATPCTEHTPGALEAFRKAVIRKLKALSESLKPGIKPRNLVPQA